LLEQRDENYVWHTIDTVFSNSNGGYKFEKDAIVIGAVLSIGYSFVSVFFLIAFSVDSTMSNWTDRGWIQVVLSKTFGSAIFLFPSTFLSCIAGCIVCASLFGILRIARLIVKPQADQQLNLKSQHFPTCF
jgi:hypothetical protein